MIKGFSPNYAIYYSSKYYLLNKVYQSILCHSRVYIDLNLIDPLF